MLKASNGGGGRGMRIVQRAEEMAKEYTRSKNESKKAFGDDKIFVEKYLKSQNISRFRLLVISMEMLFIYMTVTALYREDIRRL